MACPCLPACLDTASMRNLLNLLVGSSSPCFLFNLITCCEYCYTFCCPVDVTNEMQINSRVKRSTTLAKPPFNQSSIAFRFRCGQQPEQLLVVIDSEQCGSDTRSSSTCDGNRTADCRPGVVQLYPAVGECDARARPNYGGHYQHLAGDALAGKRICCACSLIPLVLDNDDGKRVPRAVNGLFSGGFLYRNWHVMIWTK